MGVEWSAKGNYDPRTEPGCLGGGGGRGKRRRGKRTHHGHELLHHQRSVLADVLLTLQQENSQIPLLKHTHQGSVP